MSDAPVVVIAGPTASGKSGLALEVAEALTGTIVNADSMQVYDDLRILTARPSVEDEARVPHRLYGYRQASDMASAADWARDARAEIADIRAAARRPIVVGGTGLYLRALMEGIAEIPQIPKAVRDTARERRKQIGAEAFHQELAARDPESAARLHATDSQRMSRAWEVFEATGRALSDWHRDPVPPTGLTFRIVVLMPARDDLYANCESRFDQMLEMGALDEVRALASRAEREQLSPDLPIFKALGYPALSAHLRGEMSLEDAKSKSRQQTRNYAKRQMTWLRHQLPSEGGEDSSDFPVLKYNYNNQDKILSFLS
ncbi:MAG: tRNA (adenosine(37)-N6)-dimethylallyltransferase MiaA [Alphaproteobacteria bacterium]